MPLNPQQQIIADHHSGPMLGISVAGSGKTTTLVQNLVNKYTEKAINPMRVFATAFNKDVADELKMRIMKSGFPGLPKAAPIGTSHSLFRRILVNENWSYEGIITEWTARDIILNAIGKKRYRQGEEAAVLGKIGLCKNHCAYYKPLEGNDAYERFLCIYESLAEECDVDSDDFLRAFAAYELGMRQKKLIDMDDMLFQAWVMFTRYPDRLKKWQNQFDHILVDEYQDTNEVQYQLFKMLAAGHQNFIALGDDDQAIYGFRGANPSYIRTFLEDYPHAQYVAMETNYRSQHGVLDAANRLIGNNKDRYPKQLLGIHKFSHVPQLHELAEERHEAQFIAEFIKANGFQFEQTAVLTRVNCQQAWLEEAFVREKVPYTVVRGTSFFKRKEIVILTNYLRYAKNPTIELVRELANKPYRFIRADMVNDWRSFQDFEDDARHDMNVQKLYEQLEWVEMAYKKYDLMTILDFIINRPCYMATWATKQASLTSDVSPTALIQQYCEMASDQTVDSMIEMVDCILHHYDDGERNKVRLSTIHSAKGLEWDHVFVPGMNEEMLPHKSNPDIEEERRLAYVALTRARKDLILTTYRKMPASMFLHEILPTLETTIHETPQEKAPALTITAYASDGQGPTGRGSGRELAPVYSEDIPGYDYIDCPVADPVI